jgi:hypothetical protein
MLPWTALLLIHVVFSRLPKRRHVTGSEHVARYMKGLRDLRHDKLLFLAHTYKLPPQEIKSRRNS